MHSVEVMDEALHGLESLAFDIFVTSFDDFPRPFGFFKFSIITIFVIIFDGEIEFFTGKLVVLFEIFLQSFAERFVNAWSHGVVKVWDRLTTVLLVLVGLE